MNFNELNISDNIKKGIKGMGFTKATPIQEQSIPVTLKGKDVMGQAQTGSGKTVAFAIPIIEKIFIEDKSPQAIVLCPTRELCMQVADEISKVGSNIKKLKILSVYGGQPIGKQTRVLKKGVHIVVGTPGRVIDHINRGTLDLVGVETVVLDEADEMLNMGFIDDIESILKGANKERQTLLFSATMPAEIKKLAKRYMKKESQHISIVKNTITGSTVSQFYFEVKNKDRFETLCRVIDVDEPTAAIIFCKTKRGVDELVEAMQSRGYSVEGMHGDMTQNHRMNTLRKFKEGSLEFLIATDVAARGIDVENVSHVINYDLPQDTESYVHRIGRTGRANREGIAYTLVTAREYMTLKQIERTTKGKIKRKEIPTIDDIFYAKYKNICERVQETLNGEDYKKFIPMVTELDEEYNLIEVSAALMSMIYNKEVSFDYTKNSISSSKSKQVRLFLSVGKIDRVNPKTILNLLNQANVYKEDVGEIDLFDKFSFVDVSERVLTSIMDKCNGKRVNGRRVRIEVAKGR